MITTTATRTAITATVTSELDFGSGRLVDLVISERFLSYGRTWSYVRADYTTGVRTAWKTVSDDHDDTFRDLRF